MNFEFYKKNKNLDISRTKQKKTNEKHNYNQGLFYLQKTVLQWRQPLKIGPKSKKMVRKSKKSQ